MPYFHVMQASLSKIFSARYRPLLILIFVGEIIFFLPFVLARVFRPTVLEVYGLNNLELGTCFSVYGITAMVSYILGGPLADRFEARHLLAVGLWATSFGGFYAVSLPSYTGLLYLYGYWGVTTIFLFWAALIRATREWGGQDMQGKAFGFLEGGRGLIAALVSAGAVGFFAWFSGDSEAFAPIHRRESFQIVLLLTSVIVFSAGLVVYYGLPRTKKKVRKKLHFIKLSEILQVIKLPSLWLQTIMVICAYVGYKITDDYSLFANEVLEMSQIKSAGLATIGIWLRPVFAIAAGLLADRLNAERVISWCFALMVVAGAMIFLGWYSGGAYIAFAMLTAALMGIYGLRGVYFAIMNRGRIPIGVTGTAVGIISFLGFTPDIFISPTIGYLLDTYPGPLGHEYIFGVMALFGLVGFITSLFFKLITKG